MGSKHIIFFKATEYKYFYKDIGFSDGKFVYRTGSDGNYIVSKCLKLDYSDVVIPIQTVNPLTDWQTQNRIQIYRAPTIFFHI